MALPEGAPEVVAPRWDVQRAGVVIVLAVACFLRFADALRRPLYADEGLSLTIGAMPLRNALGFLASDVHPPLFFLALHGAESVHAPIWAIRLAAALIGVASVWLLMWIVRQWSCARASLIAGACAAVMPSLILYDGWIRMYVLLQFLELAAFAILTQLVRKRDEERPLLLWAAWAAVNIAVLYTHYLAWLALASQLLFVVASRRRVPIVAVSLGALVACAAWLPQLPTFERQLAGGGVTFGWFQTHLVQGLWQLPSQSTVDPEIEGWVANAAAAVIWLWMALAFVVSWRRMRTTILPWLAVPAVLTVIASLAAHKYLYDARYFLSLPYALAAWTGVAVDGSADRIRSRPPITAALVPAAALTLLGCAFAFDSAFYTADWPAVAGFIRGHAAGGDVLLFEPGMGNWALPYYLDERSYSIRTASTRAEIDSAIASLGSYPRVWLIGSGIIGVDPQLRLLHALQASHHLRYFEQINRAQPSQDVQTGLFEQEQPMDGAGHPLGAYAGSFAANIAGRRLTIDIAYRQRKLYVATGGRLPGTCWIAASAPGGIEIVQGTPADYALAQPVATDVVVMVRLTSNGLTAVEPRLEDGQQTSHYVRIASTPELSRMWQARDGVRSSCLPEQGRGGRP